MQIKKTPKVKLEAQHNTVDGLSFHKNVRNGFMVIELDYWADPIKKDPEWIAKNKAQMPPKQWALEMERSWETFAGQSVYDKAFYKHLHVTREPFEVNRDYPIFRGWDFGGNQSVIIAQIIGSRLYILDELPNAGTNTREFAPRVIAYCNQNFGDDLHYVDVVDPSGMWDSGRAEGRSNVDVMRDFELAPIAASTNDPGKRIDAVIELLMRLNDDGKPALLISPRCQFLIQGFDGGYHYPEKPTQSRRINQPVKNLYSHIHDALQYVALRMKAHSNKRMSSEDLDYERSLTRPNYNFSKR